MMLWMVYTCCERAGWLEEVEKLGRNECLKPWCTCIREKLLKKKSFCNTNIEKIEILHVLHDTVALLMRRRSERGARNCHQIIFRKFWTIEKVGQKMNFYMTDEIEIRFRFYRSFSTFWNIFDGLCTRVFYSSTLGKKLLEVIFVKSKVIQPQPKYKTRNFLRFNSTMKRLLRGIHWNQKQIGKWYLVSL